jgi:uncharacterized repeat protein (TIGR01451 family)/CSLREA domain-containing protein
MAAPIRAASTITVTTLADTIDHTDGVCSLREAIIAANTDTGAADCAAGGGADTIMFDAALAYPGAIVLSIAGEGENAALTGDLDLSGSLTINGPGSTLLSIDGNRLDRVFEVLGGARVSVTGLQIKNGDAGAGSGGGFAINSGGVLTLTNSRVISNAATYGGGVWLTGRFNAAQSEIALNHSGGIHNAGGIVIVSKTHILSNTQGYGIWNEGALVFSGGALNGNAGGGLHNSGSPAPAANLSDVSVIGNTGGSGIFNASGSTTVLRNQILSNTGVSGGGIYNGDISGSPSLNVQDSLIGYNIASVDGGGIFNYDLLTLRSSTLLRNTASSGGGLHYNSSGGVTLSNVTFSGNAASDNGGAIYNKAGVILVNVTIADNTAEGRGGAIFNDGASSWSKNTIWFGNSGVDGSCSGEAGVQHSQGYNLGDDATCNLTATGDITNTDPLLGPLQDNGGPTPTQALQPGSPAIDHGTNSGCPATDQRGLHRPQGASCDMGAYEAGGFADLAISKQAQSSAVGVGMPLTYTIVVTNYGPLSAAAVTVTDHLPPGVALGGISAVNWSCSAASDTITCTLPGLALISDALTITAPAPATAGLLTNTVDIGSATPDLNLSNNSSTAATKVVKMSYVFLPLVLRGE